MGDESIWLLRETQKMRKKVTAFKREVAAFFAGLKAVDKEDNALCACSSRRVSLLTAEVPW